MKYSHLVALSVYPFLYVIKTTLRTHLTSVSMVAKSVSMVFDLSRRKRGK